MPRAALIERHGGPEVFVWRDVGVGRPGPGEARVRHTAVGLNWADLRYRQGGDSHYPVASLPAVIGLEAAGVVEEVGAGVTLVAPGDRVAYGALPLGAYAEERVIAAADLYRLPEEIGEAQAAAAYLKGLTAQYLAERAYPVAAGETVLVHAAAGGVGSILCQIAKSRGARVIGTAGGADKAAYAEAHGCDHAIDYHAGDFGRAVVEIVGERAVDVVYDSVGLATFAGSLDLLRPRGMMVSFGHASGKVPPLDIVDLRAQGLALSDPLHRPHLQQRPRELRLAGRRAVRHDRLRLGAGAGRAALRPVGCRPSPPRHGGAQDPRALGPDPVGRGWRHGPGGRRPSTGTSAPARPCRTLPGSHMRPCAAPAPVARAVGRG